MRTSWAPGLAVLLFLSASAVLSARGFVYFQTAPIYEYRVRLLELVLSKTAATDGTASAVPFETAVTQGRGLELLETGVVDVAMLPTSRERESRFIPVRTDILWGILGYRVLLARRDRLAELSGVRRIEDLRRFKAGFGAQWADLAVLKANRLPVFTVANTETLIPMLDAGRFDYFPRGINEAWTELEAAAAEHPGLAVEGSLALFYTYPVYFFVRKDNLALADRLSRGLAIAARDGSFKRLFLDYHRDIIKRAGLSSRLVLTLENPDLPAGTPPVDTAWWMSAR